MSESFVVKNVVRKRRRRLTGKPDTSTPTPTPTPIATSQPTNQSAPSPPPPPPLPPPPSLPPPPKQSPNESNLPEYLINPPEDHLDPGITLEPKHTRELVCSYRVAKEVLGSSFRPKESNLATGKIRL